MSINTRDIVLFVLFSCNFSGTFLHAQPVAVSEVISENKITLFTDQKLILVDFWATWCVPCVPANEQLEVLQEKCSGQIFMISLSDEPAERVRNHILLKTMNLMVAIDDEHYTTDKYEVKTRPFAIVLNLAGKVVWKGHPAELQAATIEKLYQENAGLGATGLESIMSVPGKAEVPPKKEYVAGFPELDSVADGMLIQMAETNAYDYYRTDSAVLFQGNLSEALQQILLLTKWEMDIPSGKDRPVRLLISEDLWNDQPEMIVQRIKDLFALDIKTKPEKMEGYMLVVRRPKLLWDRNQMDLKAGRPGLVISNDRLQADNATIGEMCLALSEILDFPVFYEGNDRERYDWDFHFRYENLMQEELEDSYGIELEKKWIERTHYKIR